MYVCILLRFSCKSDDTLYDPFTWSRFLKLVVVLGRLGFPSGCQLVVMCIGIYGYTSSRDFMYNWLRPTSMYIYIYNMLHT